MMKAKRYAVRRLWHRCGSSDRMLCVQRPWSFDPWQNREPGARL